MSPSNEFRPEPQDGFTPSEEVAYHSTRNPAYDGPMGIFTDYQFCDDPTELEDEFSPDWLDDWKQ
jgi:hypothetical protein